MRAGREPASLQKASEALRFTGMPVCPEVIRARSSMQTALANGRSVEEYGPSPAEHDMAALWRHVRLEIFTEHPMLRRAWRGSLASCGADSYDPRMQHRERT